MMLLILSKYFLFKHFIKFHKAQFINRNNARSFNNKNIYNIFNVKINSDFD